MGGQKTSAGSRIAGRARFGPAAGEFFGKSETGALLLTLAVALGLWLFIAGNYRRTETAAISRSLVEINSHRAAQISAWHDDHVREAVRLGRHPFFGEIISEEISNPGSRRGQLGAWLDGHLIQKRYASLAFLSPKGTVIAATPGYAAGTEKHFRGAFARASQKGEALFTDLYLAEDGRPRMTMLSPMSVGGRGGKILCVLVINIDPEEFYPLLKTTPQFFKTTETMLVRKEGGTVLFLSELDYLKGSALKLTRPLSDTGLPAVKGAEGYSGFFEGVDYRGVKVLSAISPVAGTNWALVTKIDRDIILGPVKTRESLALALILLMALLFYGVFYLVLRSRERAGRKMIREGERRLAVLFSNLPGSAFRCANDRNWTMEFLSEGCLGLTGYSPDELLSGKAFSFTELIVPEDRDHVRQTVQEALSKNEKYMMTCSIKCKDGAIKTVWAQGMGVKGPDGKIEALEGFIGDISPLRRAEADLHKSEQIFREFMEHSPIYVFFKDENIRAVRLSRNYETMLGKPLDELLGRSMYDLFPSELAGRMVAEDMRILKEGKEVVVEEELNGRTYMTTKFPISIGGKPLYLAGYTIDITERRRAELEREKLTRNLIEKKREMENFLYITTHDLRSPLVNILGFSRNLERYIKELREILAAAALPREAGETLDKLTGELIPEALKFVVDSSRNMDDLIAALLKVARIGRVELKPETVDMNALLKKILDSMRYQLEKAGGAVTVQPLPPCWADPGAIDQLFSNLLDNAVKYRAKDRPPLIKVTGETKGAMALYTVADNGSGIPETYLRRIWNVSYQPQGARERKGEGIGLPMVKRLAERSGGDIRGESRQGEGSVFYVELPAAGEE